MTFFFQRAFEGYEQSISATCRGDSGGIIFKYTKVNYKALYVMLEVQVDLCKSEINFVFNSSAARYKGGSNWCYIWWNVY